MKKSNFSVLSNAVAQKIKIYVLFFLVFFSCKKMDNSCSSCSSHCSHQTGDIKGNWKLLASRYYSAPNNLNPPWSAPDPNKPVTLSFSYDSIFTSSENFYLNSSGYDRYRFIDPTDFQVYSSIDSFTRSLKGKILNSNEIQLTFMGVDGGTDEKYTCY